MSETRRRRFEVFTARLAVLANFAALMEWMTTPYPERWWALLHAAFIAWAWDDAFSHPASPTEEGRPS